jgi:hypothetical protein
MTAINVLVQHDKKAVHLITDGSGLNEETNNLEMFTCKVRVNPFINAAGAARGLLPVAMLVTRLVTMSDAPTYDGWKATIIKKLQDVLAMAGPTWDKLAPNGSAFELVCIGLSETTGPNAFIVCNHSRHGAVPPMTIVEIDLSGRVSADQPGTRDYQPCSASKMQSTCTAAHAASSGALRN